MEIFVSERDNTMYELTKARENMTSTNSLVLRQCVFVDITFFHNDHPFKLAFFTIGNNNTSNLHSSKVKYLFRLTLHPH